MDELNLSLTSFNHRRPSLPSLPVKHRCLIFNLNQDEFTVSVMFSLVFDSHDLCLVVSSVSSDSNTDVTRSQAVAILAMCVCMCLCTVCFINLIPFLHPSLHLCSLLFLHADLSVTPDDMKQRDVVEDLVSVVPGVQSSLSGIVVHHADVRILVVEGNISILVRGGVGVIGEVDLGAGQVGICDVEGTTDHEGLPCAALRKPCVPTLEHLQ